MLFLHYGARFPLFYSRTRSLRHYTSLSSVYTQPVIPSVMSQPTASFQLPDGRYKVDLGSSFFSNNKDLLYTAQGTSLHSHYLPCSKLTPSKHSSSKCAFRRPLQSSKSSLEESQKGQLCNGMEWR